MFSGKVRGARQRPSNTRMELERQRQLTFAPSACIGDTSHDLRAVGQLRHTGVMNQDDVDVELHAEVGAIMSEITALKKTVDGLLEELPRRVGTLENRVSTVEGRMNRTDALLIEMQLDIRGVQKSVSATQQSVSSLQQLFSTAQADSTQRLTELREMMLRILDASQPKATL